MTHECSKCGKEFDSERGLNIHKSQMHPEAENNTNEKSEEQMKESKTNKSSSKKSISLTAKEFGGLTFATGLFIGIVIGLMFGGFNTSLGSPSPTQDIEDQPAPNNEELDLVRLESGDYPYQGIEAGISSENRTFNGHTFRLDGEPYIGSSDATVTAISYEDFECPFCKQYNDRAFNQIRSNYIQSGDVQYFYKHLTLGIHPWAEPSALASECALNQDPEAFWTFKQGFFDNQQALGNLYKTNKSKFDKSMYAWANQTGLDKEQFRQCYDNREEIEEVREDKREAANAGARATPTIIINGEKVEGAQPYSNFRSVIETALGQ